VKPTNWVPKLLVVSTLLAVGCVYAPNAPPRQDDLSADYAAFDQPNATLPDTSVQSIVNDFALAASPAQGTGVFGLVRKLVTDSNQALASEAGLLDQFTIDGTAVARLPCAASATTPPPVSTTSFSPIDNGAESLQPSAATVVGEPAVGQLTLNLGAENSKIQRTLVGSAQNCELMLLGSLALPVMTMGAADLRVDLGGDLELGAEPMLPILIRATNVQADSGVSTEATALAPDGYEVRVTAEGAVQLLVQPSTYGAPVSGTIVVTLFADGTIGVRDRRGTWTCTRDSVPCAFAAST
jgi:hypothetical protein